MRRGHSGGCQLRFEHQRDAGQAERHAGPATPRQALAEQRCRDGGGRERLQRAEQGHHAGAEALRHGPIAGAEIDALQQRARQQMLAEVTPARPCGASAERDECEDRRRAAEAREQKEIGIGVGRDRAGDHETGRPQHDEQRGD